MISPEARPNQIEIVTGISVERNGYHPIEVNRNGHHTIEISRNGNTNDSPIEHTVFAANETSETLGSIESTRPILDAKSLLDQHIETAVSAPLGPTIVRTDIQSLTRSREGGLEAASFNVLPEYKTQYPEVVTNALGNLYQEYNKAFSPLVAANKEWETDYQYAITPDGTPINGWVQIDMVGLPDGFLQAAESMPEEEVQEVLRGRIFEIENSLAMYGLLERVYSNGEQPTNFDQQFRASLDELRERAGKPVALLAVTEQKYDAMRTSEFGKTPDEPLTDEEVKELSGFDKFFSPEEFQKHLEENGGDSAYVLYARTSDPLDKLKKPGTPVSVPLLENPETRRVIKANAITFNVDNPTWAPGDPRRINDTKRYLSTMKMAHPVFSTEDAWTTEEMKTGAPKVSLNPQLKEFLQSQGVDPSLVESRQVALRAKPLQGAYGCYGHVVVDVGRGKDRQEVKRNLASRGPYVIQPERETPVVVNEADGQAYTYIDRNFFTTNGEKVVFMGGFRSLMPLDTFEAHQRRIHGNGSTVWAEIS